MNTTTLVYQHDLTGFKIFETMNLSQLLAVTTDVCLRDDSITTKILRQRRGKPWILASH